MFLGLAWDYLILDLGWLLTFLCKSCWEGNLLPPQNHMHTHTHTHTHTLSSHCCIHCTIVTPLGDQQSAKCIGHSSLPSHKIRAMLTELAGWPKMKHSHPGGPPIPSLLTPSLPSSGPNGIWPDTWREIQAGKAPGLPQGHSVWSHAVIAIRPGIMATYWQVISICATLL